MAKQPLDLYRLFKLVVERGGLVEVMFVCVCLCLPFCMHVLFVRGWLIHCSSAALIKSVCHILSAISFSILLNTLEIAN